MSLTSFHYLAAGRLSIYHWLSLLLVVTYVVPSSASNWPSVTICTDNGNMDLLCPKGQKLVLAEAQYGLKNATTPCPGDGDVVPSACLRDVTVQLQTLCFGNNSCNISLHSASLQNTDPCMAYGVPFLTINYTCLPDNLLAELACGAVFMSRSDLGGLLSSADYPRTFPRRSDICVQTLHLPPGHSLSLSVIDVDLTPGQIVIACGNEVIIGILQDNISTCHCQPLKPSQEIHFRGNVTFRLFERSTPARGVLFEYKVYRRQTFVERAHAVCRTSFAFPGEPNNIILKDYRNITWPNSVKVQGTGLETITPGTGTPLGLRTTKSTLRTAKTTTRTPWTTTRPPRTTGHTPWVSFGKPQDRLTPTFRTITYSNGNEVLKPTAKSEVIHHHHYHKQTVAIAVGASVGASLLVILLALTIFALCRRNKSKPPPPTEMTPTGTGATPDPLDCDFGDDDMEGLDNPTYGILP